MDVVQRGGIWLAATAFVAIGPEPRFTITEPLFSF
jgi:hypothetical protein